MIRPDTSIFNGFDYVETSEELRYIKKELFVRRKRIKEELQKTTPIEVSIITLHCLYNQIN